MHRENLDIEDQTPLCVDLDGTLIKTDLLFESFFALLVSSPLAIFLAPFWLLKGKAYLKQQIADRVDLDPGLLPYDQVFLEYLQELHRAGRPLILVTAASEKFANRVAVHLGIFEAVLASDGKTNLSGSSKAAQLRSQFPSGFDYAGNAHVDLKIWRHARRALLVNPQPGLKGRADRIAAVERVFDTRPSTLKVYLRALRLHQWLKNCLIFIPLLAAHRLDEWHLVQQAFIAFLAFGLCASSVYLLNDMFDLAADRHHPRKRFRPLAAGTMSIKIAAALIPGLLLCALGLALLLPPQFLWALAGYYAVTLGYSLYLKRIVLLDVLVLAGLYTIRIIAGAAAVAVIPSFWLLAFSMFLFFSLAVIKRYSELLTLDEKKGAATKRRDYRIVDLDSLISLGTSSGLMAVLVLALYINSPDVTQLYTHPEIIWLLCPLLMYWIGRVWLLTRRGQMHDDPVVFAIKDIVSWGSGLVALVILIAAS